MVIKMTYYDKKLGVYLPEKPKIPIKIEKPKKKKKVIPEPPIQAPPEVVYVAPPPKEETILIPPELTLEEKKAIRRQALEAQIAELEPYHYEVDEDGVDWWICNTCKKAYNSETVQKRHQTLKHK